MSTYNKTMITVYKQSFERQLEEIHRTAKWINTADAYETLLPNLRWDIYWNRFKNGDKREPEEIIKALRLLGFKKEEEEKDD